MSKEPVPQIENERLNIHDTDQTTAGGPPGWVAFAIVAGIFLFVVAVFALMAAFMR